MRQHSSRDVPTIYPVGVVIALLFALMACTNSSAPKVTITGTDPLIIVQRFTGAHEALLSGTLTYEAGSKCLRIGPAGGGGQSATPVWPSDTRPVLIGGKRGVDVPDVGTILEGDGVKAKGGGSTWRKNPPSGVAIPDNCLPPGPDGAVMIISEVIAVTRSG
ncbi:hypothetical protein [Streptosporangium sp. NPDC002607]